MVCGHDLFSGTCSMLCRQTVAVVALEVDEARPLEMALTVVRHRSGTVPRAITCLSFQHVGRGAFVERVLVLKVHGMG